MSSDGGSVDAAAGERARSILITGCSSGIGLASAQALRARGWSVAASCRQEDDCARLRDLGFFSPRIDYQDEASIASGFAETLTATGGRIDALYNNGAFACPGAVEDLPTDALREIFEANLFGWHALTRLALPVMRAQGAGRIVQCSSILGLVAMRYRGAYVATKFALEGLTDALRLELAGSGVSVILLEPGPIRTPFHLNSYPQFRKWIRWEGSAHAAMYPEIERRLTTKVPPPNRFELPPEAVAKKLIRALESKRPRPRYYVTTPTFVGGLARRALPTRLLDMLLRGAA